MNKNYIYTVFFIAIFFLSLYVSKKMPNRLLVDKSKNIDYSFLCFNTEPNYCSLYQKILFGVSSYQNNLEQLFYKNGVGHLLSISGLHIYSILNIIFILLNSIFLLVYKEKYKHIPIFKLTDTVSILCCCIYVYQIEASIPRLRSLTMVAFVLLSYKFSFLQNKINVLILSAALLAIFYPDLDTSLSFYYSYVSVFAIYVAKDKNIFSISFLIFILLIPLNLFTSGELNVLSIINNVIFVPLFTYLLFPALLVYSSVIKIFPFTASNVMSFITKGYIYLLELLVPYSDKSSIRLGFISSYNAFLLFFFILIFYMFLFYRYKNPKVIFFVYLGIIFLLIQNFKSSEQKITIFDIDKKARSKASGDFILASISNKQILLDTGYINAHKTIKKILRQGITELDLLILSHEHEDHIGGLEDVFKQLKVKNVVISPFFKKTNLLKEWAYACKGSKISLDNNSSITFLNPDCSLVNNDENNSALVFLIKNKNYNYLFFSDIDQKVLDKILRENIIDFSKTIVQYPHHCSKTVKLNINPILAFCTKNVTLLKDVKNWNKPYALFMTGKNGDIEIIQKESKIYTKTDKYF